MEMWKCGNGDTIEMWKCENENRNGNVKLEMWKRVCGNENGNVNLEMWKRDKKPHLLQQQVYIMERNHIKINDQEEKI